MERRDDITTTLINDDRIESSTSTITVPTSKTSPRKQHTNTPRKNNNNNSSDSSEAELLQQAAADTITNQQLEISAARDALEAQSHDFKKREFKLNHQITNLKASLQRSLKENTTLWNKADSAKIEMQRSTHRLESINRRHEQTITSLEADKLALEEQVQDLKDSYNALKAATSAKKSERNLKKSLQVAVSELQHALATNTELKEELKLLKK